MDKDIHRDDNHTVGEEDRVIEEDNKDIHKVGGSEGPGYSRLDWKEEEPHMDNAED